MRSHILAVSIVLATLAFAALRLSPPIQGQGVRAYAHRAFQSSPFRGHVTARSRWNLGERKRREKVWEKAGGVPRASLDALGGGEEDKRSKQGVVVDKIIELGEDNKELPTYLRENLVSLDQDFWMTYMTRYDKAADESEKQKLQTLANSVMKMIEELVQERQNDENMKRIAVVDRLVEEFLQANEKNMLSEAVRASVGLLTQDNNFWSRVAARYDSAQSQEEKARVAKMARDVQDICRKLAEKAGQSQEDANAGLQKIMAAAANEKGEWFLPLTDVELGRMREAVEEENGGSEELISLSLAWMKRATEAEEQEVAMVVGVIQKVLHTISAVTLTQDDFNLQEGASTAAQLLHQTLQAREERWDEILTTLCTQETVAGTQLLTESDDLLQKVLFTLPAGSNKQRVLVEYIQEIQDRIRKAYKMPSPAEGPITA
ncbi:hypothetical protein AAMO2058_001423600 [Amorphochlora amoebiformis]